MNNRTPQETVLFDHNLFNIIAGKLLLVDFGNFKYSTKDTRRLGVMFEEELMREPLRLLSFMAQLNKIQLGLYIRYLRRYAFRDADREFYHQAIKEKDNHIAVVFAVLMSSRNHVINLHPYIKPAHDYLISLGFIPNISLLHSLAFLNLFKNYDVKAFDACPHAFYNLRECQLSHVEITNHSLNGACLEGADLTQSTLDFCSLVKADLHLATLTSTSLIGCCLKGADLSYASCQRATICGANMMNANLCGTDFTSATTSIPEAMPPKGYYDEDFEEPKLTGAKYNRQTTFPSLFFTQKSRMLNVSSPAHKSSCLIM